MTLDQKVFFNSDLDGTLVEKPNDKWRKLTKNNLEPRDGVFDFLEGVLASGQLSQGKILTARPRLLPPPLSREQATNNTYSKHFAEFFEGFVLCGRPFAADEAMKARLVLESSTDSGVAAFVDDRSKLPKRLIDLAVSRKLSIANDISNTALHSLFGDDSYLSRSAKAPNTVVLGIAPGPNQKIVVEDVKRYAFMKNCIIGNGGFDEGFHFPGLTLLLHRIPNYTLDSGEEFADAVASTLR